MLTKNPLDPDSNIQITIPSDFSVPDVLETVTVKTLSQAASETFPLCESPLGQATPKCFDWDSQTATIVVNQFNAEYIPIQTNVYIEVGKFENPAQAGPSNTFTYVISDSEGNPIETAT